MKPKSRSRRQRLRQCRNVRPSCVGARRGPRSEARPFRCRNAERDPYPAGPIVRLVADQSFGEEVEEAVREDPSTSWLSCGATLSTLTARGRLWSSATQRRFSCLFRVVWAQSRGPLFRSREGGIDECLL